MTDDLHDRIGRLEDELTETRQLYELQQRLRRQARELEDAAVRQRDAARAALADVLAEFDAIRPEEGCGDITEYRARVLPRQYEQWQAALTAAGPAATQATDQPTHNAGPSVAECAANDRAYWERKDAGDQP
jgi:TolA-binding protein